MTEKLDGATLFRQHGPFVHRLLRRLGVPPASADDALQEVFVIVHRRLESFAGRGAIRAWISRIAVRVASRYRHRQRARREFAASDALDVMAPNTATESLSAHEARQLLEALLDRLDDEKRTVFVLYELEELTMQEVAQSMNIPLQTAYSRLHAAREILCDAARRSNLGREFK